MNLFLLQIYDVLVEAGRPLLQKELLEKLNARGVVVNSCQLTLKLITQFQDVFCCEFEREGRFFKNKIRRGYLQKIRVHLHVDASAVAVNALLLRQA